MAKTRIIKKPKRFRTPYIFYVMKNRQQVKCQLGTNLSAQVMQEMGRRWRRMPPQDKCAYVQMAHKDKLRYNKEMDRYRRHVCR